MAEEINMNDDDEELEEETSEDEETSSAEKSSKHKKMWYKSAWFWIIVAASVILVAALVWFFAFYRPSQSEQKAETDAEKALNADWAEIVDAADALTSQAEKTETVDDFSALSQEADSVIEVTKRAEDRFSNQDKIDNTDYQEALESITSYMLALQAVADKDVAKISTDDFTSVKDLADASEKSVKTFQDNTDFIRDALSSDFFDVVNSVKDVYDAKIEEDKQKDEEARRAEEEAKLALEAEEKAVNDTVIGFTDAYIEGDLDGVKKFMTASLKDEFDYSRREGGYYVPVSYRIIDKVKNSDSRYYVYGRMTEKVVGGTDQYSYDYNFTVIKDGTKWLVDLDQAPSR